MISDLPQDISAEDVRQLLRKTNPQDLTLLDVRQDWEYEEAHLPGAQLLPLAELEERVSEIARGKPLVIYCRSGKRSAAAASLLSGQGFQNVSNMLGGILAWTGAAAVGTPETGMQYLTGSEAPGDILALAYSMEHELGVFYQGLAQSSPSQELREVFAKLAGFEDKHKLVVYHLYKTLHPQSTGIEELASKATVKAMEGGRSTQDILAENQALVSAQAALEMAMGIEAQALDLYTRYAAQASDPASKQALFELAGEERGHLRALATMMDKIGKEKG